MPKGLLLLCLVLGVSHISGCATSTASNHQEVALDEKTKKQVPLELYVEDDIKRGIYEPTTGIYTGAYVEKDANVAGDLLAYEKIVGQTQIFKVFEYNLKESLPSQEILKCIAQKKVPYIKIVLRSDCDLTPLYHLIFDLKGSYNVPVFIELYPLTSQSYTPLQYKKTYQRAYEIIHKYVKQAVIVWSTDETRVLDMPVYYPGDKYVDWVGINIYIPRYKKGERYIYQGTQNLDFWYKNFQHTKPMLISSLAISHFSRVDHVYTISETQEQLDLFYNQVLTSYPRLRGILYMDIDMQEVSKKGQEDYRLTSQPGLIETMKLLSAPLECLDHLDFEAKDEEKCYMKYSIIGTYFEDELYISEEYITSCFPKVPLRKISTKQDLSGEIYYAYNELSEYCTCYYKT